MMRRLWLFLVLPIAIMALVSCGRSTDSPAKVVPSIIKYGRLAELPESATNVKAYAWRGIFTGTWFLRFEASAEDIQLFISSSPSIKDVKPEMFTPQRKFLPYPDPLPDDFFSRMGEHEYYQPDHTAPGWCNPAITIKGRLYKVPAVDDHNWGEVIVDDEKNVVFISIIWS